MSSEGVPVPDSPSRTLYDRLGGGAALRLVVDRFYEIVLLDPVLRPYFTDVDLPRLRRHQALFLSQVTGGPTQYGGQTMFDAHAGRGIDDDAFDRVAAHLVEALRDHQVATAEIDEVVAAVSGLRPSVVERPKDTVL
jgi:hemoglobin